MGHAKGCLVNYQIVPCVSSVFVGIGGGINLERERGKLLPSNYNERRLIQLVTSERVVFVLAE